MIRIDNVSFSAVGTTLKEFGATVKRIFPRKQPKGATTGGSNDKFNRSDAEPRSEEERTRTAVIKSNEANKERLVAEINRSGEIDSIYDKLLPEYFAYQNPELADFTPIAADTVTTTYKKKQVEIKFSETDDGNKQQEITFSDGSKINYIIFTQNGKIKINEEEFEMPEGTIIETKTINDRIISQLTQTPDMQRKVINKPEYLEKAEEALQRYTPEITATEDTSQIINTTEKPTEETETENRPLYGQTLTDDFLSLTKNPH